MLRIIAVFFGLILLALGAIGFIPEFTPEGKLFGVFSTNLAHNLLYIVTGAIALLVGLISEDKSALFFQIFGIVFGLVALLGFYYVEQDIFGFIANNMASAWMHLAIASIALYLGFLYTE